MRRQPRGHGSPSLGLASCPRADGVLERAELGGRLLAVADHREHGLARREEAHAVVSDRSGAPAPLCDRGGEAGPLDNEERQPLPVCFIEGERDLLAPERTASAAEESGTLQARDRQPL